MKNLFLAFLFCSISTIANAQSKEFVQVPKVVLCSDTDTLLKGLADEEINEKPIWIGKSDDKKSDFAIFVNPKTSAFTVIQFSEKWGCILGLGEKSHNILGQGI